MEVTKWLSDVTRQICDLTKQFCGVTGRFCEVTKPFYETRHHLVMSRPAFVTSQKDWVTLRHDFVRSQNPLVTSQNNKVMSQNQKMTSQNHFVTWFVWWKGLEINQLAAKQQKPALGIKTGGQKETGRVWKVMAGEDCGICRNRPGRDFRPKFLLSKGKDGNKVVLVNNDRLNNRAPIIC